MSLSIPSTSGPLLKVEGTFKDGVVRVSFTGEADIEAKPDIDHVVQQLHDETLRLGAKKVEVDFRHLEFMNSSCFKVFVSWLANVQELPAEQQYRITLQSNPNLHWQRRSLAALSCFAVDLVTIET